MLFWNQPCAGMLAVGTPARRSCATASKACAKLWPEAVSTWKKGAELKLTLVGSLRPRRPT
jgi:hypothetical protein